MEFRQKLKNDLLGLRRELDTNSRKDQALTDSYKETDSRLKMCEASVQDMKDELTLVDLKSLRNQGRARSLLFSFAFLKLIFFFLSLVFFLFSCSFGS
jgi:hypothetical protein